MKISLEELDNNLAFLKALTVQNAMDMDRAVKTRIFLKF